MAYYLCKTEPELLRFHDLLDQKELDWAGVTNPAAIESLRNMHTGDEWIIYHAGREGVALGTAKVVSVSTGGAGAAPLVRVQAGQQLKQPKTQNNIFDEPLFDDSPLVSMGRLPVVPLTPQQWEWFLNE